MTGETEKGRSIKVISKLLPGNSNLAMAQAAAMPKIKIQRHRNARGDQSQLDGASGIRLADRLEIDLGTFFETLR